MDDNRYQKLAVSLPAGTADRAHRAVKAGRAASVSAYIAAAIDEKAKHEELQDLLDEMLAETGGPTTPAERRAAERELLGPAPRAANERRAPVKPAKPTRSAGPAKRRAPR